MAQKKNIAELRRRLYANIRSFFDKNGYLEVETPILSSALIPEPTIDNFSTMFMNEFLGSRELYLLPSPELYMKKLIAEGYGSIYQISKCFRNAEQVGRIHSPEFSMLEYYTTGFDEKDSIALTIRFLRETALEDCGIFEREPEIISVRDAVLKCTGLDLDLLQNASDLRSEAVSKLFLNIPLAEPWEDTFNRIFCTFVETARMLTPGFLQGFYLVF